MSTASAPKPWLYKDNADTLEFEAGENLWTELAAADYPKAPVRTGGIPLYLNPADGKVYKLTPAQYLNYIGILEKPTKIGQMAVVRRKGIIKLPIGSIAVSVGDLVQGETDGGGTDGDIVPMADRETLSIPISAAYTGGVGGDQVTLPRPITGVSSAAYYDASANGGAGDTVPLTPITSGDPGAGEILIVDSTHVLLGTGEDLADGDTLILQTTEKVGLAGHTIGKSLTGGAARTGALPAQYTLALVLLTASM